MNKGELLIKFLNAIKDLKFPEDAIMYYLLRDDFLGASDIGDSSYYDIAHKEEPAWVTAFLDADDPKKGRDIAFELFVADFLEEK